MSEYTLMLEIEIEGLKSDLAETRAQAGKHFAETCRLEHELAEARAQIAAKDAALRPFADDVERLRNYPDDYPYSLPTTPITVGDLRRAAAALAGS